MRYLITILTLVCAGLLPAQNINWSSLHEGDRTLTYLNFGYDFGLVTQLGYAHKIQGAKPILLTADYSFPMGKDLTDDFKMRIGGQLPLVAKNNFKFSAKAYGVFRRHETALIRMASFGSDLGIVAGYYKAKWHLAVEYGFDKSVSTHLKHASTMRENYPDIQDGWYLPSGGHHYYGIQVGYALGEKMALSLRAGSTNAQSTDQDALLPSYAQLGLVYSFKSKNKSE